MKINVNARWTDFDEEDISYEQVVEIAALKQMDGCSCNYTRGRNGESGILCKGETIKVTDGMIINVILTNNA